MMVNVCFSLILTLRYQYELELFIKHTNFVIFLGLALVSHMYRIIFTADDRPNVQITWRVWNLHCFVMIYYISEVNAKIKIHISVAKQ